MILAGQRSIHNEWRSCYVFDNTYLWGSYSIQNESSSAILSLGFIEVVCISYKNLNWSYSPSPPWWGAQTSAFRVIFGFRIHPSTKFHSNTFETPVNSHDVGSIRLTRTRIGSDLFRWFPAYNCQCIRPSWSHWTSTCVCTFRCSLSLISYSTTNSTSSYGTFRHWTRPCSSQCGLCAPGWGYHECKRSCCTTGNHWSDCTSSPGVRRSAQTSVITSSIGENSGGAWGVIAW